MFGLKRLTANDARQGATSAYSAVMNHPKTTGAVVLGTAAAAAIWWLLRDPQRVEALRKQISNRTDSLRKSRLAKQLGVRDQQPSA